MKKDFLARLTSLRGGIPSLLGEYFNERDEVVHAYNIPTPLVELRICRALRSENIPEPEGLPFPYLRVTGSLVDNDNGPCFGRDNIRAGNRLRSFLIDRLEEPSCCLWDELEAELVKCLERKLDSKTDHVSWTTLLFWDVPALRWLLSSLSVGGLCFGRPFSFIRRPTEISIHGQVGMLVGVSSSPGFHPWAPIGVPWDEEHYYRSSGLLDERDESVEEERVRELGKRRHHHRSAYTTGAATCPRNSVPGVRRRSTSAKPAATRYRRTGIVKKPRRVPFPA